MNLMSIFTLLCRCEKRDLERFIDLPKITQWLSGPIKGLPRWHDVEALFLAPSPGVNVVYLILLAGFIMLGWLHNVKDSLQFPEWGGPSPDYCSQDFCVQIGLSRRIACLLNVALAKLVPDWVYHIFRWQFSPIVTFTVSQGVNIVLRSLSSNWLWFQILVLPSRYVAMHKWSKLLELQSCICQAKILAPSS